MTSARTHSTELTPAQRDALALVRAGLLTASFQARTYDADLPCRWQWTIRWPITLGVRHASIDRLVALGLVKTWPSSAWVRAVTPLAGNHAGQFMHTTVALVRPTAAGRRMQVGTVVITEATA